LTHVFRWGVATRSADRYRVCCTVVFDDAWVIHRDVCGALLELTHRVAARLHYLGAESVGLSDRPLGIIHELALDLSPGLGEAGAFSRWQLANVQRGDSIGAL
jgi:hypothetical protein